MCVLKLEIGGRIWVRRSMDLLQLVEIGEDLFLVADVPIADNKPHRISHRIVR